MAGSTAHPRPPFAPYATWVAFAGVLNAAIVVLNPRGLSVPPLLLLLLIPVVPRLPATIRILSGTCVLQTSLCACARARPTQDATMRGVRE